MRFAQAAMLRMKHFGVPIEIMITSFILLSFLLSLTQLMLLDVIKAFGFPPYLTVLIYNHVSDIPELFLYTHYL